ncbi:N-methyl-L-tryptophan oxidase [Novosphingobium sp. Gsoil 351]|nr:N-methyl-L-tryptophan oxidase [Novosphingobium sp. Gsoil 351]
MGSAALYQLARAGVKAVGIDRFAPPHDRGSSHGETRITRCGVGEGEAYVPLAIRSHAIWRELEAETGTDLLLQCGFMAIDGAPGAEFHGKPSFFECTRGGAERFGVAYEDLSIDEARRRFPQFHFRGDERLYYEPGGGLVYPERCIAVQLHVARALGAELCLNEQVLNIVPESAGVLVETDRQRVLADRVVLAAGGWTPALVGEALAPMRLLRQVLHWFALEEPAVYSADRFPTFIWAHGSGPQENFYGFPIAPGATGGLKVATEQYQCPLERPEAMDRNVVASESTAMFADHVAGRLRGARAETIKATACFYTQAPDSDFVIDCHPMSERIAVVSACSGHGFKHSAAVGELVAAWIGQGSAPPKDFALRRAGMGAA